METWRRTLQEKIKEAGKTQSEVSRLAQDSIGWRILLMPYTPLGVQRTDDDKKKKIQQFCFSNIHAALTAKYTVILPKRLCKYFFNLKMC